MPRIYPRCPTHDGFITYTYVSVAGGGSFEAWPFRWFRNRTVDPHLGRQIAELEMEGFEEEGMNIILVFIRFVC